MAVSARIPAILQPLLGALLGLLGAVLILNLPRGPGAVAAVVFWTAATFASGERGFARWFPKLPLFGTLLAACTILLRWYALISLQASSRGLLFAAIAAMTLGPAAAIALGWLSPPVDDAAVRQLSPLTTAATVIAIAQGTIAALAYGLRIGCILLLVVMLLVRQVSAFMKWRRGGVRGSDLDGFRVVVETLALVLAASLHDLA